MTFRSRASEDFSDLYSRMPRNAQPAATNSVSFSITPHTSFSALESSRRVSITSSFRSSFLTRKGPEARLGGLPEVGSQVFTKPLVVPVFAVQNGRTSLE